MSVGNCRTQRYASTRICWGDFGVDGGSGGIKLGSENVADGVAVGSLTAEDAKEAIGHGVRHAHRIIDELTK